MRKATSTAVLFFAFLTFTALVSGCGGMPEDAAATVDGKVISKQDVADRTSLLRVLNSANLTGELDEYFESIASKAQGSTIPETAIQQEMTKLLVAEEIDILEAKTRGIAVTEDEIAETVETIITDSYLGDEELLDKNLGDAGLTRDDLRDQAIGVLYHQKLVDSLQAEVVVSEAEVRTQYEARGKDFVYPETRQIRQVVSVDEATAQTVASRIAAGENMTVIASKESIDAATAAVGGRTDLVTKQDLPQTVGDVAFSLGMNQVSPAFKSDLGWYVIRVELINVSSNRTFEQARDEIAKALSEIELDQKLMAFQTDANARHVVEYAAGYKPGRV